MREWIDNGTALGWLIDADRRTVWIYHPGGSLRKWWTQITSKARASSKGLRLDLGDIFRGL